MSHDSVPSGNHEANQAAAPLLTAEQAIFVRAILSGDAAAPLIYADWLDERREPGDAWTAKKLRATPHARSLTLQSAGPLYPYSPGYRFAPRRLPWLVEDRRSAHYFRDLKWAEETAERWRTQLGCTNREIYVCRERELVRRGQRLRQIAVYGAWVRLAVRSSKNWRTAVL
ncbi:MAG TPA: hypothetical protein VGE52_09405 [Pirellulales bacterium]